MALYLDAAPFYAITAKTAGSSITNLTKGADRAARGYAPSRVEMRALFVIAGLGRGRKAAEGAYADI